MSEQYVWILVTQWVGPHGKPCGCWSVLSNKSAAKKRAEDEYSSMLLGDDSHDTSTFEAWVERQLVDDTEPYSYEIWRGTPCPDDEDVLAWEEF